MSSANLVSNQKSNLSVWNFILNRKMLTPSWKQFLIASNFLQSNLPKQKQEFVIFRSMQWSGTYWLESRAHSLILPLQNSP